MASTLLSSSSEVQTTSHHPSVQDAIQKLSKAGTKSLQNNEAAQALSMFKKAYVLVEGVPGTPSQKMCLFNLGAAYVARGKPEKGLKCLLKYKSKGPVEKDGDLYFNIAAAYEEMKEYSKAGRFYQRAIREYIPNDTQSISDALIKLGYCSADVGDLCSAAHSFRLASNSYQKTQKTEDAAMAMREAARYMIQSQKFSKAEVLETLNDCAQLCSGLTNLDLLGKLYNHIGLHYAEMMCFHHAGKCFIKAMQICSGANFSIQKRAVLQQNLGAVYNVLCQYEISLRYHGEAAELYGALRKRNAQGQSLCNLAYAYSQLKNYDMAEYYYQQALNAFVDVGDLDGQQQVCEGLGATSFCVGDLNQAIAYYKQALTLFGKSKMMEHSIKKANYFQTFRTDRRHVTFCHWSEAKTICTLFLRKILALETSDLSRERVFRKLREAVKYQASCQSPVSHRDDFSNTAATVHLGQRESLQIKNKS